MTRTLALDLDSTLAATQDVAFELMEGPDHGYSYDDVEDWKWGFREFGKARYLSALWHAWTLRPRDIEPIEDDVEWLTKRLNKVFDTVDVVTANPDHYGIAGEKHEWLHDHDIPHDDFVVVDNGETKADLDYDVYIDDKPGLAKTVREDQRLYLYDQRYNRHVDCAHRVESLHDVIEEELSLANKHRA